MYFALHVGKSAGRRWFFGKPAVKGVYYFCKTNDDVPPLTGWQVYRSIVIILKVSVIPLELLLFLLLSMNIMEEVLMLLSK